MVKDIADYVGQLFETLMKRADWVVMNSESLGQTIACLMLLQLLVRVGQIYEDIKYMLAMLLMSGGIRAIARTYMIEADKSLVQTLAEKGLIDPTRAQDAITVLETETQKIAERWNDFREEFANAMSDVNTSYNDAVSYILDKFESLGCREVFSV